MSEAQFEKVCKGLEFCIRNPRGVCAKECPYKMLCFYTEGETVKNRLMSDALALINAQQERINELEAARMARVMTLEEVSALEDGNFVWIEINGGMVYCLEAIVVIKNFDGTVSDIQFNTPTVFVELSVERINKRWRCWTSRPSEKQREATQWAK